MSAPTPISPSPFKVRRTVRLWVAVLNTILALLMFGLFVYLSAWCMDTTGY